MEMEMENRLVCMDASEGMLTLTPSFRLEMFLWCGGWEELTVEKGQCRKRKNVENSRRKRRF